MANKKKITTNLFADSDEDPTAEIMSDGSLAERAANIRPELEVDEQTFEDEAHRHRSRTQSDLYNALSEQSKIAEELRFEVEHLRNQQRGLQEELRARTEITASVNSQLLESRSHLSKSMQDLESRKEEVRTTQAALDQAITRTRRLKDKASVVEASTKELKTKIRSLESQLSQSENNCTGLEDELRLARQTIQKPSDNPVESGEILKLREDLRISSAELSDLRSYVDGRKEIWAKVNAELEAYRDQLTTKSNDVDRLSREIHERTSQMAQNQAQHDAVSEQLVLQKAKTKKLDKKIVRLQHELDQDARNEIEICRSRIIKQSGKLAAQFHELECLRKDNERIQQYSDSMRIQLQNQCETSKAAVALKHRFESDVGAANQTIGRLTDELDIERQSNSDMAETIERVRKEHEREIRQVRFELGAAEDTLAGQESINGQLASDLIDNKGYREALEIRLNEIEKENQSAIRGIADELRRARQDADDYARKLRIKDRAITDLMKELTNQTRKENSVSTTDNTLQKIDGYKTRSDVQPSQKSRERVARLLIGSPDGRELRFPLFKTRLTIGRTSHNDIQLNMQYVSRRHAVISTEHGNTRVIDWGSKNGVFVNNQRVTERVLESGDIVSIGTADFKYEERPKR